MRDQRLELYALPDYRSRRNKANDYGFDPHEQATETYTGMGLDINVHDQWAVESIGQDSEPHARTSRAVGQGHHPVPAAPARGDRKGARGTEADALP